MRTSNLLFWLIISFLGTVTTGCESKDEKIKNTVRDYLYKNMKNPESLKILSFEIRTDTVPFYLNDEILSLADECNDALNEYVRYKDMSYLWANEKYESVKKVATAKENFETAYKIAKENAIEDVQTLAYVKASGTNPMGGIVSLSTIFIIDNNDPTKVFGAFTVDKDLIMQFVIVKTIGEGYEFKTNKYGKYETNDLTYLERFIMNDAE